MSTITVINENTQAGLSRTDINANFANLNTDKIETSTLDTDTTLAANSDTKIPTQKAVKAYVDAGGNPNASETQAGISQEATDAQVTAGTATGSTGAKLFVTPAKLAMFNTNFGDGSDGDVTISSPTTLARDMYYNNLVVTDVLTTNGFRIFVKGTISGAGTIKYPQGNDGAGNQANQQAGSAGGTAFAYVLNNVAGSAGGAGNGSGAGSNGTNIAANTHAIGAKGAVGGTGGTDTYAGGVGGTQGNVSTVSKFGIFSLPTIKVWDLNDNGSFSLCVPGIGGSGGGAGGAHLTAYGGGGGGGGASGGIIVLVAKTFSGTFTIEAKGGNGGNGNGGGGPTAGTGGGGAGGAGGVAVVIYGAKTWTGSYVLTGGNGGDSSSQPGTDGTPGANGTVGTAYEFVGNLL